MRKDAFLPEVRVIEEQAKRLSDAIWQKDKCLE